jgi:PAS domain S-box-containing protein
VEASPETGSSLQALLFDAAGEGIVIMDSITTRILDANPKACEIHGYAPGELVGRKVLDLLPDPPDEDLVLKIRRSLAETGRYESETDFHRRKDGTLFPCGVNLRQVELGGRPYKLAIYRDLSEQHRLASELRRARTELEITVEERTRQLVRTSQELAQQIAVRKDADVALRESETRLRMMLTQLPAVLWTTDARLRFTSMTGRGLRNLPGLPGNIHGHTLEEVMGPGEATVEAVRHHRQALSGGSASYIVHFQDRYFSCHVEPLRDSEGQVIGVIGVSLDDTGRIHAEKAVRQSEAWYQVVFEKSPVGIGIASRGIVRYVNPAWLRMFRFDRAEEVLGSPVTDHLTPASGEQIRERARRRHAGEDVPAGADLVGVRKDGSTFDYHIESCRLEGPSGDELVVLGTDVTEERRAQELRREIQEELERKVVQRTSELARAIEETRLAYENLKSAQAQLIRSEKLASIGMLVSGVAHEINNPLNVIMGNLALLTETDRLRAICSTKKGGLSRTESRKVQGMLEDALRASRRACSIIETFRAFARDTRSAERVDLNEVLEETLRVLERQFPSRIRLSIRLGRIPKVRCFRGQLGQVFLNLLQNASEAIDGEGEIRVRSRKSAGFVEVEVADTGKGMSPEVRDRVFDPFFTTKPPGKGLGLGLSISAMIVHNHSGSISLKSRPGKGTSFQVRLPVDPALSPPAS